MPTNVTVYRCLIISPGDVAEERDVLTDVIERFNVTVFAGLGIRVEGVRWEKHAIPDQSMPPQPAINEQLADSCDLGVAVFWARLGTPTDEHESGSTEEIARLLQRGARVMVYRKTAPVPQERLRDDQYARLTTTLSEYEKGGLLGKFGTPEELRSTFQAHLAAFVAQLNVKREANDQPIPSTGTLTAPTPDVRVSVRHGFVVQGRTHKNIVELEVQNHSPVPYFHKSFVFETEQGSGLWPQRDAITKEGNGARRIESGDSHSFSVDPKELARSVAGGRLNLKCGASTDKIGRVFRSNSAECVEAVEAAFTAAKQHADEREWAD